MRRSSWRRRRRVSPVLQMTSSDCAAACLAMILRHHGRATSLAECRAALDAGRDGATAREIAAVARQHGLRVRGFSVAATGLAALPQPLVAHWNANHFVVVERCGSDAIVVLDPAVGRRRLSVEEFAAGFGGVVLAFEPGPDFERRHGPRRAAWLRHLRGLLDAPGTPAVFGRVLVASAVLQALGLVPAGFTKLVVDSVLPHRLDGLLPLLGVGLVVLTAAEAFTTWLRAVLLVELRTRLDRRMMLRFCEHLLALPFRFFQQRTTGDLVQRFGSNALVRETVTGQTIAALLDGPLVLVYAAILLAVAPVFGGFVAVLGALQMAIVLATTPRVHELLEADLAAEAAAQGCLVETLAGVATVKASGAEVEAFDRWAELFAKQLVIARQRDRLAALFDAARSALDMLTPLLLLWIGAQLVLDASLTAGTMLAATSLAVSTLRPLAALAAGTQRLQLARAHVERIADVLDATCERVGAAGCQAPTLAGRVELAGVGFRYAAGAPDVVRDVSLVIEPGQKVALVGPSGSGKSTLAKLLLGLHEPTAGCVRYDGIPLGGLELRSLRRQFGAVLQEPFLFSGSIAKNIAGNASALETARIEEAARLAAIHDDIVAMPLGYDTLVSEGGSSLSGGQRQRLALARALVRRPAILVLDEATSHLDVVTEAAIERNLGELDCTRVVIAHRLSTVRDADLIVVLDGGAIVERGTHEELVRLGGHYAQLVRSAEDGEKPRRALYGAPPPGAAPSRRCPGQRTGGAPG